MNWPTYPEAKKMAKRASATGFVLCLLVVEDGWEWTWRHEPSGFTFTGICHNEHKAIALVCALQAVPVISK